MVHDTHRIIFGLLGDEERLQHLRSMSTAESESGESRIIAK